MLSLETSGPLIRMLLLQLPCALTLLQTTCTNCKNCSRITFKYHASKSNCACVGWIDLWIIPQDGTELFWLHEEWSSQNDAGSCTAVWYHLDKIVQSNTTETKTASIFTGGGWLNQNKLKFSIKKTTFWHIGFNLRFRLIKPQDLWRVYSLGRFNRWAHLVTDLLNRTICLVSRSACNLFRDSLCTVRLIPH